MHQPTQSSCVACRLRHIKCDQTRPFCLRCKAAGRTCDGYPEDSQLRNLNRHQIVDALQKLGSDQYPTAEYMARQWALKSLGTTRPRHTPMPGRAGRALIIEDFIYFDYFRRITAPNTDSLVPSNFWGEDLLQLAHNEPAIWHACLALGALHQRWEMEPNEAEVDSLVRNATRHYGKALSLAKELKSPAKLLALSLTLIASANMLGYWRESHVHILCAFKILAQDTGRTSDAQRIASTLTRMDIQSLTLNGVRTPYPYREAQLARGVSQGMVRPDAFIESYSQASSTIFAIIRELMLNSDRFWRGGIDAEEHDSMFQILLQRTGRLERQMGEFETERVRLENEPAAASIRIYHGWLRTVLKCEVDGPESRFDAHLGFLERIITLAYAAGKRRGKSAPLKLSLEPALIAPLFSAISKCRHPALRRHGLRIMREMKRHEGMWRSDAAALTVEEVIALEEEGDGFQEEVLAKFENYCEMRATQDEALAVSWDAWSTQGYEPPTHYSWLGIKTIPEARRVKAVVSELKFESREMEIGLILSPSKPEEQFGEPKYITFKF